MSLIRTQRGRPRGPCAEREDARGARGSRAGRRVLAQLDAGEARRDARRAGRVLADGHRQRRRGTSSCGARVGGSRCATCARSWIPGVFFGLNLAVFFAGATHNSVANAALIGSLRAVPDRAGRRLALPRVHRSARAGVRGRSRSAAWRSCCSARRPAATPRWRATCSACSRCCCWSAYVASTRHFRRDMDVTTFMATICPIAAVAVLPLAIAHGDVFGMSGTGWTYMLILTFTSGVAAHGLLVYAQKTIQIGTIGIAQVAQPALAVVWSFLLLGEVVNGRQVDRHRDRHGRLCSAFTRGSTQRRRRRRRSRSRDEVRGGLHARVGGSQVERCVVAASSAGERVEGEDFDGRRRRAGRRRGSREPLPRPARRRGVERGEQACRRARPARRRRRRGATRPPPRAPPAPRRVRPSARRTRPRWTRASAASRTSPVASALSIAELQRGRAGVVVAGLALRASEAGELVGLGLQEAEPPRRLGGPADVARRRRRSGARRGPARRASRRGGRGATGRRRSRSQCWTWSRASRGARDGHRRRSRRGRRRARSRPGPTAGPARRRARVLRSVSSSACVELAVVRHDVGEVVGAARLQVDVVDRVGQLGRRRRCARGRARGGPSTLRSTPRAAARSARSRGRGRVAGGVERGQDPLRASAVAEDDPGPAEPVGDVEREQRVVRGAPGQRGVDVGALGAGEREVLGLLRAAHALRSTTRPRRRTTRRARRSRARSARRRPSPRARTRGCCRAAGSGRVARRRRRSPASGSRAGRRRRSPPPPARRARRARTRPPASGAPPAKVASAHRPRWSSGNSRS